jgi:hypothetical protein
MGDEFSRMSDFGKKQDVRSDGGIPAGHPEEEPEKEEKDAQI